MRPLTNCAPKAARYSASFCSSKRAWAAPCWPKTATSSWPVKVSSISELSAAGPLPLGDELRLGALGHHRGDAQRQGHRDQRDQGEQRGDDEHHHQHPRHGQSRGEQLAEGLLQGLADVVQVVGHPGEQLAARAGVEVRQRQPVDLVLHVRAQPVDGALDDLVEQSSPATTPPASPPRRPPAPAGRSWRADRSRSPGPARPPSRRAGPPRRRRPRRARPRRPGRWWCRRAGRARAPRRR